MNQTFYWSDGTVEQIVGTWSLQQHSTEEQGFIGTRLLYRKIIR